MFLENKVTSDHEYEYEYQFRDIDEGIYLKRKSGESVWEFTTKEDFEKSGNETFHSVIEYDYDMISK